MASTDGPPLVFWQHPRNDFSAIEGKGGTRVGGCGFLLSLSVFRFLGRVLKVALPTRPRVPWHLALAVPSARLTTQTCVDGSYRGEELSAQQLWSR